MRFNQYPQAQPNSYHRHQGGVKKKERGTKNRGEGLAFMEERRELGGVALEESS